MAKASAAAPQPKDFYQILGIGRECTAAEITKVYKKLALKHHPDKNLDNREEADRLFKEISEAYHHVGDAFRRADYDKKQMKAKNIAMGVGLGTAQSRMQCNPVFMQQFGMMRQMMPGSMMRGAMPGPRGPIGCGSVGMGKAQQAGNSCASQMGKGSSSQMGNGCGAQMGMGGIPMMNWQQKQARPDKAAPKQMPMMNPMMGCGGLRGVANPMMAMRGMHPMMAYDVAMMMRQMKMDQVLRAKGCGKAAAGKGKPTDGEKGASPAQESSSSSAPEPKATPATTTTTTAAGKGKSPQKTAATPGKVNMAARTVPLKPGKFNGAARTAAAVPGCKWCEKGECWTHGQIERPKSAHVFISQPEANAEKGKGKKRSLNAGRNGTEPLHEQVQELCNVFSIEEKIGRRLDSALLRRPSTFEEDMKEIWDGCGKVPKAASYLTLKCQEMERGVFATGKVGYILRELRSTFNLSTDTAAGLVTAFANEDTAKALANLKLLYAQLKVSSDPCWTADWLLENVMEGGSWSDAPPTPPPRDAATRTRSRSRSRSRSQAAVKRREEDIASASTAGPPLNDAQHDASTSRGETSQEEGQCDADATAGCSEQMDESSWDESQQWEASQQWEMSDAAWDTWEASGEAGNAERADEWASDEGHSWGVSADDSAQQGDEHSWDDWEPAEKEHSAGQETSHPVPHPDDVD